MATMKSYDDLANAEVNAIQKRIDKVNDDYDKANNDQTALGMKKDKLLDKMDRLEESLRKAKNESARLKKFIWRSDNINIIELRNQIMLAAKLIIDQPNP